MGRRTTLLQLLIGYLSFLPPPLLNAYGPPCRLAQLMSSSIGCLPSLTVSLCRKQQQQQMRCILPQMQWPAVIPNVLPALLALLPPTHCSLYLAVADIARSHDGGFWVALPAPRTLQAYLLR